MAGGSMSKMDDKIRERVRRGVALLNDVRPSWTKRLSVGRLELESCEVCVLGQLYGDYEHGLKHFDKAVRRNPTAFGFTTRGGDEYWEKLNAIWREEIAAQRRARKKAAA
jgi:hypothetical protein